jgi:hypothetical protein
MARFGLSLTQRNFPIVSESHLVQWEHVRQGLGIGVMTADIGDHDPMVVRALPEVSRLPFRCGWWRTVSCTPAGGCGWCLI